MTNSEQFSPVQRLAAIELAKRELAKRPASTDAPAWTPFPGPQTTASLSAADVIGYGGAAGGGKSDLTIGLALTQHQRSVIFRREATQARGLFDRARALCPDGQYNATLLACRDLPGGRQLEFAGVKDANDVQKWRGRPHDLIGFDEATEFLESQVRFLAGWLRSTEPGQKCQLVLTFNPPSDANGRWIVRFFAPWLDRQHPNPALPGELRFFAMLDGKETELTSGEAFEHAGPDGTLITVRPLSRTFIPARLSDNPALSGSGYANNLAAMPEPYRSQLLYGDFPRS